MYPRSRFNVPSCQRIDATPPIVLPAELPEGHLELPALDRESANVRAYLQRPNRWCFNKHLENLPRHGVGQLHQAIYRAAVAALAEEKNSAEVHYLLRETAIKNGRPRAKAEREVVDALVNAHSWFSGSAYNHQRRARIPEPPRIDWSKIRELALGEENLATLQAASGGIPETASDVLKALYDSKDLICCAKELHTANTRPLNDWLADGLVDQRLVVANPMRALTGMKADGKLSPRCNDNAGPCRWIVVEFDFSEESKEDASLLDALSEMDRNMLDLGASLHCHLQQFLPLAMVVFSGRSSLHGWYAAASISVDDADRFRWYCRSLKADPALFVPCQLTRMPWGTRENGNRQSVVYFNPEVARHDR